MALNLDRNAAGFAFVGLGVGLVLFAIFYIATVRGGIAERFTYDWMWIHLAVLFLPAIALGLYGATRKPSVPQ